MIDDFVRTRKHLSLLVFSLFLISAGAIGLGFGFMLGWLLLVRADFQTKKGRT